MQMDLINAQNQLESALEELKRRRILRDLMHDYISDALRIVKNLIIPDVTNSEKGKLVAIDNDLYLIKVSDWHLLMAAIGSACGVNCPETRQDVRKECLNIKKRYKPIACEFHQTPEDQFPGTKLELKGDELPF